MNSLDRAFEDCLGRLNAGQGLEACLRAHPQHAAELRPLLLTALELQQGSRLRPPAGFVRRSQAQVMAFVRAHPHVRGSGGGAPFLLNPVKTLVGVFSVFIFAFFATGTALAQSALPGQSLYSWKLTSEKVWQTVSPDPVATTLAIAQRRTDEAQAVSGPARDVALQGYENVLNQIAAQSQSNPSVDDQAVPVLKSQQEDLAKSGIKVPKLNEYLSDPKHEPEHHKGKKTPTPTATPTITPTPGTITPFPTLVPTTTIPVQPLEETPTMGINTIIPIMPAPETPTP